MHLGVSDMQKSGTRDSRQPLIPDADGSRSDAEPVASYKVTTDIDLEETGATRTDFQYSHGLSASEAEGLLKIHGKNELPEKTIPKWYMIYIHELIEISC